MDMIENIRSKDGITYFDMDSDITVVKFVIPLGFADMIQRSGYAHLIEHMIIQTNKKYLTYLEKQGIQFNAETKDCLTEYIFIDLQSKILLEELKTGNLEKIFDTGFEENSLAIEKGTIAQEHLLLSNQMEEAEVSKMIGSPEEIANFQLEKADKIRQKNYSKYDTMVFANSFHETPILKGGNIAVDEMNWFEKVDFLAISRFSNGIELKLKRDLYSEILTYCLRIWFCDMLKEYRLKVEHSMEQIHLKIVGNIENIESMVQYKQNAYHYYYLLLTSFKYLCNEVTYVTQHLTNPMDIEKIYMENNWEGKFCEKILCQK